MTEKNGSGSSRRAAGVIPETIKYIRSMTWPAAAAWMVLFGLVLLFGLSARAQWNEFPDSSSGHKTGQKIDLPAFTSKNTNKPISRSAVFDTTIPKRARVDVTSHSVEIGDSVFSIAKEYDITPETLLWANYEVLNDNPDLLSMGMMLNIPPVDGVYYQWQNGDTIESVADKFKAKSNDILEWAGNKLDLVQPVITPGQWLMIPGGQREFRQWVLPTISRGHAGVSSVLYGGGACEGGYSGALGTGSFVWPTPIHELVGNDYWSGHLAVDLATNDGLKVMAADSGVVVFAGWGAGGYGYMVMIDHGNDYATLYAHLSQVVVNCGNSVTQGQVIGFGGSSGNSTGPHLHFEVRYQDGFVNPWFVLP